MKTQSLLTYTARDLAEKCSLDVRTVNKHVITILEDLGYSLDGSKNSQIENYGEFSIQRLWSPTGRLNHLLMNHSMAEMLATRFDTKTAYQMRSLLISYKQLGGVLIQNLFNTYGKDPVFEALFHLNLIPEKPTGKTFTLNTFMLKNEKGTSDAIFIQIPVTELVSDNPEVYATRMVKSLYFFGNTAYSLIELLSKTPATSELLIDP